MKPIFAAWVVMVLSMLLRLPVSGVEAGLAAAEDPRVTLLERREGEDFEATFLVLMIDHHQIGKKMAALVAERAGDAELKRVAERMSASQTRQIEQLDQWLKQWHPRRPGDDIVPEACREQRQQAMEQLQQAKDAKFDQLFTAHWAEHQAATVAMARLAAERAIHEEVKAFAAKVVEVRESPGPAGR